MNQKLKNKILDYLVKDLDNVEIIYYKDSVWFIDRGRRHWYFEYHKTDKHLWWRWSYFQSALKIFSLNGEENQSIFGELVSSILNKKQILECKHPNKVFKTVGSIINFKEEVKEILNHEVKKTLSGGSQKNMEAHKVLDHNVETTAFHPFNNYGAVEEVLNNEVKTTNRVRQRRYEIVEKVLNCEVKTTSPHNDCGGWAVEEVLNHDVKTTGEAYHNDDYVTEEILNNTINTYGPGNLVDEEKHINNVLNYGTDTIEIKSIRKLKGESPLQDIVVSHILDESEKVTDKLKIKEDDLVKSYGCDVFMCDFLVQNVLEIGSNSINFDVTSQQGRVDGVLKNS